jgi:hypothetical protein
MVEKSTIIIIVISIVVLAAIIVSIYFATKHNGTSETNSPTNNTNSSTNNTNSPTSETNLPTSETDLPTSETHPSSYLPTSDAVPSSYTVCGNDGSSCELNDPQLVYYGAGNKYVSKNLSGTILCGPPSFNNIDPSPGKMKTCYVLSGSPTNVPTHANSVPSSYIACGTDGSSCKLNGPQLAYYGAGNEYISKNLSGTIFCGPPTFNNIDPSPGHKKTCYVSSGSPVTS